MRETLRHVCMYTHSNTFTQTQTCIHRQTHMRNCICRQCTHTHKSLTHTYTHTHSTQVDKRHQLLPVCGPSWAREWGSESLLGLARPAPPLDSELLFIWGITAGELRGSYQLGRVTQILFVAEAQTLALSSFLESRLKLRPLRGHLGVSPAGSDMVLLCRRS